MAPTLQQLGHAILARPKAPAANELRKLLTRQRVLNQLLIHKLATLSEVVYQEADSEKKAAVALELIELQDLPDNAWLATMNIPLSEVMPRLRAYVPVLKL